MNKAERHRLCSIVAEWEWNQGGSASEAAALGQCARRIIEEFALLQSDLNFARSWEIAGQAGIRDDYEMCDKLDDLFDERGYDVVIDLIERVGFHGLSQALSDAPPR